MDQGGIAVVSLTAESELDRAVRAALARRGHAVTPSAQPGRPTLAVVDWRGDPARAAGAARAIRGAVGEAPVFVLALVAAPRELGGEGPGDAALAAGADDVLAVPLEPAQLDARLAVAARQLAAWARAAAETAALTARLHAAERLAAVGTLAASVAHEVNNPLAYVIGNVAYAIDRLRDAAGQPAVDDARQALEEARLGAERVRYIVHDLRSLARAPDEAEPDADADAAVPVDLHRVLEGAINMTRAEVWPRARLVCRFDQVPFVRGSAARLGQVFANLLVNAAQAVPTGAPETHRITVATAFDRVRDRVVVEVADTGPGIPPALLARVFEPFFTTKPRGAGLGLGLSVCQRIVAALGGEITAGNGAAGGAVFRVTLVPVEGAAVAASVPPPAGGDQGAAGAPRPSVAPARRLRVLVIDDEPIVARAVQRTLAAEHDVVVVDEAREALARVANGEVFDAILCDLIMPGMGGTEFYEQLAQRAPGALPHVAFLTGGVSDGDAQQFVRRVGARCLAKPFDPRSLRAAVRELAAG